jgi:hypothetical protein
MDVEDVVDPNDPPPWLHLLSPMQKAWREKEILKGRDPDSYILDQLKEAGKWPERKPKKAKNAPRPKRRASPR